MMDFNNRRSNDVFQAVRRCNHYGDNMKSIFSHIVVNGPWDAGKWMKVLHDASLGVCSPLDDNDKLLLHLWPRISEDLGYTGEMSGERGRRAFLEDLPNMEVFNNKGAKSSASRWFPWNRVHQAQRKFMYAKLLVLIFVGIKQGWFKHWQEVWQVGASAVPPAPEGSNPSSVGRSNVPGGSGGGAAVGHEGKPQTKSKVANNCHKCILHLANDDLQNNCDIIFHLTRRESEDHSRCTGSEGIKSPERALEEHIARASWFWLQPLVSTIRALADPSVVRKFGLTVEFPSMKYGQMSLGDPLVDLQNSVAASAWNSPLSSSPLCAPRWFGTVATTLACWP